MVSAYDKDGSIRDIAGPTTRSYGAVHRVLVEAVDVTLRPRGGPRRIVGPTVA
ncbi:helix-turn-helix domain-containing protein [Streptomyces sp. NBC_00280]